MTAPTQRWPGLGFDPAPGDPAAVTTLVTTLTGTARRLQETHDALTALTGAQGAWEGEAAAAFATTLKELPEYLAGAQESLRRAGGLLDGWRGSLDGLGGRARELETRAATVRGDLVRAEDGYDHARRHPDLALAGGTYPADQLPAVNARIGTAEAALRDAERTVTRLDTELRDLLHAAEVLSDEHRTEARRVAMRIRRADDGLAPPEPSWFERAGGWVMENLGTIGDVAGALSAVAGSLALIPVLTPFLGPAALVLGGVALLAHGADISVNGKAGDWRAWASLGADAVGLVPGVGLATKVYKGSWTGAVTAWNGGQDLAQVGSQGWAGARTAWTGGVPEAYGGAGAVAQGLADRLAPGINAHLPGAALTPGMLAPWVQTGLNLGTQVPTVAEWTAQIDRTVEKDVAAGVGTGVNAADSVLTLLGRTTW